MNLGFWSKLNKPIMILAPMADVTDAAFRRIIAKYSKWGGYDVGDGFKESLPAGLPAKVSASAGAFRVGGPDVMYTEFVSADGLCHPKGREKLLIDLSYTEAERPIVAQLFSGNPEKMHEAAKLVQELGFDGLDINMGCPDRKVEKQCAGAALMKNPALARAIIRAAKEGAPNLPVSVKTRIGYNKNELETWLPELLAEKPAVVTIHCRTRKEMSDVPARWEHVREAVKIRDDFFSSPSAPFQRGEKRILGASQDLERPSSDAKGVQLRYEGTESARGRGFPGGDERGGGSKTLIFGNGDALNLEDARAKALASGADGVMLGRAIFGNPWLFSLQQSDYCNYNSQTVVTHRLMVLVEHTKLFEELFNGVKNFAVMKKHYKAYVNGFDGAKELRIKLMEAENASKVETLVLEYLKQIKV